jgi:hypothetical protein
MSCTRHLAEFSIVEKKKKLEIGLRVSHGELQQKSRLTKPNAFAFAKTCVGYTKSLLKLHSHLNLRL